MTNKFDIQIGVLYNDLLKEGHQIINHNDYELIDVSNLGYEIRTLEKYVTLKYISRHKTSKHMIKISLANGYSIDVTTDHVCMRYNNDKMLESVAAKDLNIGDYAQTLQDDNELISEITMIEDLGQTDDYVYDAEVDDDLHAFYGNDILIHNSQFANIKCITDFFIEKYKLPHNIMDWNDKAKLALWKFVDTFVEKRVNPFVHDLIRKNCFTEHPEVLRYSLEYIGDVGLYEKKKHYSVHKILSEGPEIVDKIKYSGIELKKASVPVEIKKYLGDIYESTLTKGWDEHDFKRYINETYDRLLKMSIKELSIWKGYNTSRESIGFLQMQTGATGISKACTYYNQLLEKLNIGKKYDSINIGDKVRFCYIMKNNQFGIECIAFPDGQWPKEFDDYFEVDYAKMFDKLILSPLKGYLEATHFNNVDPRERAVFDVNDL